MAEAAAALAARCCIAGGGPAGMMLGLLLARAGVDVLVLEKHADFLRDFRGDTVHPSTLQLMHELGLLDAFLARPHDEARVLRAHVGGAELTLADFSRLHARCRFIALMPQWEFLDFLRAEAQRYPAFRLRMRCEATGLIERDGRVLGVQAIDGDGPLEVRADLVIGADGRHSRVRAAAGLAVQNLGAPIDVLWLRLPLAAGDPPDSGGYIGRGHFLVMIRRREYWQCAYVIPKGGSDAVRAAGLPAFRAELARTAPMLAGRIETLASWDQVKLLSVTVDRLRHWWKQGLLCIGDAAHAMSPIGGVGINLAIQDAVAAANLLARPLADSRTGGAALTPLLARLQRRRMLPTRLTQAAQLLIQDRVLAPALRDSGPLAVPSALHWLQRWPVLRALPASLVGVGGRP
ncbi:MAG: FAD-dependent oxidoreductase, partial [Burkholderiaceae bacterium]